VTTTREAAQRLFVANGYGATIDPSTVITRGRLCETTRCAVSGPAGGQGRARVAVGHCFDRHKENVGWLPRP
jgi:hypothetical protein